MTSAWAMGSLALATFMLIVALLGVVIWSIRRHRDPDLKLESDCGIGAGVQPKPESSAPAVKILHHARGLTW